MVASVLAGEVIACVTVFDLAFSLRHSLSQILGFRVPLHLFTDSYSLFATVTKFQAIREKRLLIDLAVVREANRRREVERFGFVRTADMPADGLTKVMDSPTLKRLMVDGRLDHPVAEYIEEDFVDVRFLWA